MFTSSMQLVMSPCELSKQEHRSGPQFDNCSSLHRHVGKGKSSRKVPEELTDWRIHSRFLRRGPEPLVSEYSHKYVFGSE
mmetsp:Transcript_29386/g.50089  ORF Transcript_29386/g.50089 Transcript_29386/m.50089 type:complete len:80 (-) Transcript_29386:601-840(-)